MKFLLISLYIFTSLSTILADLQTNNGTLRIPLVRQKSAREQQLNAPNLNKYGIDFGDLIKKYPHKSQRTNDSIALYRYIDNEFYGKILIGHPGQTLNVAFDTAWTLSWVLSSKCNSFKTIGCWLHNKYDHVKSSEYKKDGTPFSANEGKYNFTGFYSYDNISIAHSNVTTQSFVEMVNVPYTFLFNKIDGVIGLGMKSGDYDPVFYNLLRQKKIKDPLFSIYLNRDRQSNRGGNILLGFIDDKHIHTTVLKNKTIVKDTIKYLPVDPGQYWKFSVDGVYIIKSKLENITLCSSCKALVDTSSNTIVGPADQVDKIHDLINAKNIFLNRYSVNCDTVNKLPKIDFVFGGKNFVLTGPQYTIKVSHGPFTICLSSFVPTVTPFENGLWILGGAFLAEYYSIYNINDKQIGFVTAA